MNSLILLIHISLTTFIWPFVGEVFFYSCRFCLQEFFYIIDFLNVIWMGAAVFVCWCLHLFWSTTSDPTVSIVWSMVLIWGKHLVIIPSIIACRSFLFSLLLILTLHLYYFYYKNIIVNLLSLLFPSYNFSHSLKFLAYFSYIYMYIMLSLYIYMCTYINIYPYKHLMLFLFMISGMTIWYQITN